jgi:hypothetical protein
MPKMKPRRDGPSPLKQGTMQKRGQNRKNWKTRFFVLMDDHLSYWKEFGATQNTSANRKGLIKLSSIRCVRVDPSDPSWQKSEYSSPFFWTCSLAFFYLLEPLRRSPTKLSASLLCFRFVGHRKQSGVELCRHRMGLF